MNYFNEILNYIMNMGTIIEIVFGTIIAIIITIIIENKRKPILSLSISEPSRHEDHIELRKHLILQVNNEKRHFLFRWLIQEPAVHCRGTVTFYKSIDHSQIIQQPVSIRWCSLPEPILGIRTPQGIENILTSSFYDFNPQMDIYPGESERIVFTIKFDRDNEFYIFNNESYHYNLKNPNWIIGEKECFVKVEIRSSYKTLVKKFKILNSKGIDGFDIVEIKKN